MNDSYSILFAALVVTIGSACGDSRSNNGGDSGVGGAHVGGANAGASGAASAGQASGAGSGGSSEGGASGDFGDCGSRAPETDCSKAAMCVEVACGLLTSQLDKDGCLRKACASDADCGAEELCFPGPVVAQVDALSPRFDPNCSASGTRCECSGKDVANGAVAYCAPRTTVLGDWGCVESTFLMQDCAQFAAWISAAEMSLAQLTLYMTTQSRAQSCVTAAKEKLAQMCE